MHSLLLDWLQVDSTHFLRGNCVKKTELVEHIAANAGISRAAAARSVDAFVDAVKTTLQREGTLTLVGFGTFSVAHRAARTGRNPRTNEPIQIKSSKIPKFKAGKALKDVVK